MTEVVFRTSTWAHDLIDPIWDLKNNNHNQRSWLFFLQWWHQFHHRRIATHSNGVKGENAFQKNPTITQLTQYALMADYATIECSDSIFSTTYSSSFSISCWWMIKEKIQWQICRSSLPFRSWEKKNSSISSSSNQKKVQGSDPSAIPSHPDPDPTKGSQTSHLATRIPNFVISYRPKA